jgi:hypothetical protein
MNEILTVIEQILSRIIYDRTMKIENMKYAERKLVPRRRRGAWRGCGDSGAISRGGKPLRKHHDMEMVVVELEEASDCVRPSSKVERHDEELEEATIVRA